MAFSPPPIKSAMGTQRWLDWFARLNDFLNSAPRVIEFKEFTGTESSWDSPVLEAGFIYRLTYSLFASSSSANIEIQLYSGGSLQTGGSDYAYEGNIGGTTFSSNTDHMRFGQLGTSESQPASGSFVIYNIRDSSRRTEINGLGSDFNAGRRQRTTIATRLASEDNEQFQVNTGGAHNFTGSLVLERLVFRDL